MGQGENSRELILDTLLLIDRDGEYSHIALKQVLDKYQYLDKKERAFITRVVNGTLERMIELDHIIHSFSKVKVNKMKPVIRMILRSGVYQIKYMDAVPDSAVCNESVKLTGKRGFTGLKGFVNGVLRNVSRNLAKVEYPSREKDPEGYLSIRYSLPAWLAAQWILEYGLEKAEEIGEGFFAERPLCVRCNTSRISREELAERLRREGVEATPDEEVPCALWLQGYDHVAGLPEFREGLFYVQDLSSMRAVLWADPKEGDQVLDVCAAPGGKAIHVAEMLRGTGMVEARDLTDYKIGLLEENIRRAGLANIRAVKWDATLPDPEKEEKMDIVLADLPCSGLGVLGKKPDLRYKMTPEKEEELVRLQQKILSVAQAYVKPGGTLVYSTCTIHRAENEENTRWFLENHPVFHLRKERQLLPGADRGDGFYIAVMEKERHG